MISLWRWGRWKPKTNASRSEGPPVQQAARASVAAADAATSSATPSSTSSAVESTSAAPMFTSTATRQRSLPRPALRWVGEGRIALRAFDFDADATAVCAFQPETYGLNFPDFEYSSSFAGAFRHDLRRATLDPHNALFVLDDGRDTRSRENKNQGGNLLGFLWIVICQNNWTGERYGYVNNLFVVPHRRGEGLGRELMRQADEFFRSRGVKRIRLTVTSSNQSAVALYEKSGYHIQRWEMEKEL